LIVEAGPAQKILAHLFNVKLVDVGNFDLERDSLFLPVKERDRGSPASLVEVKGHEFGVRGIYRTD